VCLAAALVVEFTFVDPLWVPFENEGQCTHRASLYDETSSPDLRIDKYDMPV